MPIDLIL